MSLLRAWSPYVAVVVLLIGTRVIDPIATFLQEGPGMTIAVSNVLGTEIGGAIG